jgi:APA family basic amino acid/polyamine antiporter
VPLGIVAAVGVSTALYIAVAVASVLAHGASDNPLLDLFEGEGATGFALVGSLAVANGVLVQIVMLARLFYGMASKKELPARLARIHPRTQTPIEATILAGAITLGATLLVPFEHLLVLADALTLALFALVDVALWRVQHGNAHASTHFAVPRLLPPVAAALALALMLAELAL